MIRMSDWVKCNDRLPEESDNYIICERYDSKGYECWFSLEDKSWYHARGGYQKPTYWMPFPDCPEPEGKEIKDKLCESCGPSFGNICSKC